MARPTRQQQIEASGTEVCDHDLVDHTAVREAMTQMPPLAQVSALSTLFAALADPTRIRIISALRNRSLCVHDLAVAVGRSDTAISHQLKTLRDAGLVQGERNGRRMMYTLDDAHVEALFDSALNHVWH